MSDADLREMHCQDALLISALLQLCASVGTSIMGLTLLCSFAAPPRCLAHATQPPEAAAQHRPPSCSGTPCVANHEQHKPGSQPATGRCQSGPQAPSKLLGPPAVTYANAGMDAVCFTEKPVAAGATSTTAQSTSSVSPSISLPPAPGWQVSTCREGKAPTRMGCP